MITIPTPPSGAAYDAYTAAITARMNTTVDELHARAIYGE